MPNRRPTGIRRATTSASLAVLAFASTTLAQTGAGGLPETLPMPPLEDQSGQPGTWAAYVVGVLLLAAAVGLAAMPSRREHQD